MVITSKKIKIIEGVIGKECSRCNKWKPLELYNIKKGGPGDRDSRCKKCKSELRQINKDKERKRHRKYFEENKNNPDFKEKRRKFNRKWYESNKDKERERKKKWERENPEKAAERYRRRNRKLNILKNNFSVQDAVNTMIFFDGRCALTGSKYNIQLDHVIPIDTGHLGTVYGNMIPLTSTLNQSKYNKNVFEWFYENKERFNLSEDKFNNTIKFLAEINNMTIENYKKYVYKCHKNPRNVIEQKEQEV